MAKAAAGRARKTTKDQSGAAPLIEALKFIALAQSKDGLAGQTHCAINNGRIIAFNGTFATGVIITDDLSACPHTLRLLDALTKCGPNVSIAHLESDRLSVRSDRFKGFIPCVPFGSIPACDTWPDNPVAVIDDRIKAGFDMVMPILADTPTRPFEGGALLQANVIVGTNGHMLIEYSHGIDLPPGLVIPKAALHAIVKTPKKLARFGYSNHSATFFFEDDSFIKTQLYDGGYPNYLTLFRDGLNHWPLPEGFFAGLKVVDSLAETRYVDFTEDGFKVHGEDKKQSGSYDIVGLAQPRRFNIDYLLTAHEVFKQADFETDSGRVFFAGENARGIIMGCNI